MKKSTVSIVGFAVITMFLALNTAFAAEEGDRFSFVDVPTNLQPFDDFSFTLEALDAGGEVDESYIGEVRFFTDTDLNALFPDDYEFQLDDAGVKEFSSSSFFSEEGVHVLEVVDVDNDELVGSVEITVSSDGGGGENDSLTVLSPTSGVSTSSVITFTGTTDPGLEVKFYIDGEILDSVDANVDGDFSYSTPILSDGTYEFIVETTNAESSPITVTVNTQGVEVTSVSFDSQEFSAGSVNDITVNFAQEVTSAAVDIDGVRSNLTQVDTLGRVFSGSVTLPASAGTYSLDVVADGVTLSDVGSLTVTDPFSLDGGQGSSDITFFVPSQVQNVQGTTSDRRVNLTWTAATDNTGIDRYAIFYGTVQGSLTSRVDTTDANTSWYVPNLENGQTYYFQVYGIDTEGNIGDQGSTLVSAVPGVDGVTTLHGASSDQYQVDQTSETGPGDMVFLILGSLMLGYFVNRKVGSD
jgi:hypothetical protein